MKLNCLIIDDEPLSQEVIASFIKTSPELQLNGVCNNALEAGEMLRTKKVDLLFLDINMPKLNGIEFIKGLQQTPLFILITAYPQYAVEGFEVDAVDYLLKPVSFVRFRTAINRALERHKQKNKGKGQHIMLRSDKKDYRINIDTILYIESRGDYVRFVLPQQTLTVHGTLKEFAEQLSEKRFIRIHKSYIIAVEKVEYLEGNQIKIGKEKLPVSLTYRKNLLRILQF